MAAGGSVAGWVAENPRGPSASLRVDLVPALRGAPSSSPPPEDAVVFERSADAEPDAPFLVELLSHRLSAVQVSASCKFVEFYAGDAYLQTVRGVAQGRGFYVFRAVFPSPRERLRMKLLRGQREDGRVAVAAITAVGTVDAVGTAEKGVKSRQSKGGPGLAGGDSMQMGFAGRGMAQALGRDVGSGPGGPGSPGGGGSGGGQSPAQLLQLLGMQQQMQQQTLERRMAHMLAGFEQKIAQRFDRLEGRLGALEARCRGGSLPVGSGTEAVRGADEGESVHPAVSSLATATISDPPSDPQTSEPKLTS